MRPLTQHAAQDALTSGDLARIRNALIDGCRCLDGTWLFPHVLRHLAHEDPHVRWAAVFALREIRFELQWALQARDDAAPVRLVADLAVGDLSPEVRSLAGTVLVELIEDLARR